MARTREVAGGGRAVEVEPERLSGWFDRFAARHTGLAAVDRDPARVVFRAADGASAEVVVPFGGLHTVRAPAGGSGASAQPAHHADAPVSDGLTTNDRAAEDGHAAGGVVVDGPPADGPSANHPVAEQPDTDPGADPWAVLDALSAHLAVPRRVGIVLVRLGGYSIGVAVGGVVETSTTGARPVHGRNRKGGSSSGRFARRRDNQARTALDAAADAVARFLLPVASELDAVVLGGDAAALDALRADRRLAALLARAEPRVLDVAEPRRVVLDDAARRVRAVEIVVRDP